MKSINVREAKMHLSRLIERVQAGEEIMITKAGRPVARLVPAEGAGKPVRIGGLMSPGEVPDDFNTMFEADIEALLGGASERAPALRRK